MRFDDYDTAGFYDEMFDGQGQPRPGNEAVVDRFTELSLDELRTRQHAAEKALLKMGITFSVYGDEQGAERIFPFDIVPRIIPQNEWVSLEAGLKQRIQALNLFIDDIYHDQRIVRDGIIPAELIQSASGFRRECLGLHPPGGVWCHITGTDLVRGGDGRFYVLEDNLRCPSGVSYVLENRVVMKRSFLACGLTDAPESPRLRRVEFVNLFGLFPYAATATANINVTVCMALFTFLITQYASIKAMGIGGFLKHLTGGVPKTIADIEALMQGG